MKLWQVWALLLVLGWLAVAAAIYLTVQAAYVVMRMASILSVMERIGG